MKLYGQGLTSAYDYVKSRRPCISPNLHFMGQLLKFDQQLQATAAAAVSSPDGENAQLSSRHAMTDSMDRNLQSLALSGLRVVAVHHQQSTVGVAASKQQSSSAPSCLDFSLPSRPASLSLSTRATASSSPSSSSRLSRHWSHDETVAWQSGLSSHSVSLPCTPAGRLTPQFPSRRWTGLQPDVSCSSAEEGDAQRGGLSQSLRLASPCRVAALCSDPSIPFLGLNAH